MRRKNSGQVRIGDRPPRVRARASSLKRDRDVRVAGSSTRSIVVIGRQPGALDLVLGFGELALHLLFLGPKLCASFADVADERLADVADDLQTADRSPGPGAQLLTNKFFN
jgi:hypothetical protein